MKGFKLLGFSYSPGYSDMRGGSHSVSLVQDKDGVWTMTCRDRESYGSPTSVAVYSVPEGSVGVFEIFIEKSRVLSLEKRPKSTVFATDYSPWSYSADYEKTVFGKTKRYQCRITEYRLYTKRDRRLIDELREQFMFLKGSMISETEEEDVQD